MSKLLSSTISSHNPIRRASFASIRSDVPKIRSASRLPTMEVSRFPPPHPGAAVMCCCCCEVFEGDVVKTSVRTTDHCMNGVKIRIPLNNSKIRRCREFQTPSNGRTIQCSHLCSSVNNIRQNVPSVNSSVPIRMDRHEYG